MLHITDTSESRIHIQLEQANAAKPALIYVDNGSTELVLDASALNGQRVNADKFLHVGDYSLVSAMGVSTTFQVTVAKADGTSAVLDPAADDFCFETNDTATGMTFLGKSLGTQNIYFGTTADVDQAKIYFNSSTGVFGTSSIVGSNTSKIELNPTVGQIHAQATGASVSDPAYLFDITNSQGGTQNRVWRIKNTADNREVMTIRYNGTGIVPSMIFGYQQQLETYPGVLMSFIESDTSSGVLVRSGVCGSVRHNNTSITQNRMAGVTACVSVETATGLSTNFVYGVVGNARCTSDAASFSGKVLAGVVGRYGGAVPDSNGVSIMPSEFDRAGTTALQDDNVAGDWDHVANFWADHAPHTTYYGVSTSYSTDTIRTNTPLIISGFKATIPETTENETWAFYSDAFDENNTTSPNYYYTQSAASAYPSLYYSPATCGAIRLAWPRMGGRKTHAYFIPGVDTETSSTTVGDVYFDGGTNVLEGLWENDGTAFRKLVPQSDHTTTPGSNAPTHINVPGTGAAAQVGWVEIKIDDGTSGGRTGWIPYWQ